MGEIQFISEHNKYTIGELIKIWESSVRNTHKFLSEGDIKNIKEDVKQYLSDIEYLYGFYDDNNKTQAFIGVQDQKIEMLFVKANSKGKGIGKSLLTHVVNSLEVKYVDVNEQNEQAIGFYKHFGFQIKDKSEFDNEGRPFPSLHLSNDNFLSSV